MLHIKHDRSRKNLTVTAKQRLRDELEIETEEFIKKGNRIKEFPLQKSKYYKTPFDDY